MEEFIDGATTAVYEYLSASWRVPIFNPATSPAGILPGYPSI
jgi:hypothetical protein